MLKQDLLCEQCSNISSSCLLCYPSSLLSQSERHIFLQNELYHSNDMCWVLFVMFNFLQAAVMSLTKLLEGQYDHAVNIFVPLLVTAAENVLRSAQDVNYEG